MKILCEAQFLGLMTLIPSLGCKGVDALKTKTSTPGGIHHQSFKFQWRKPSTVMLQHLGGIALHIRACHLQFFWISILFQARMNARHTQEQ